MSNKKRFIVDYIDASGDLSHIWIMADNATQAEQLVKEEYWDIKELIQVYPER